MNLFDIIILVILGFCMIRGGFRGLIKEIAAIIGVFGGFYGAYTYYPQVAQILSKWVSNTAYGNIGAFMIIFCGVFLLISLLGLIIRYLMDLVFSGWLDRAGGVLFGLLKGTLIVSVLLVALTTFLPKGAPIIQNSLLSPHVSMVSSALAKVVSSDMKQKFLVKYEELKKGWP